MKFITIKDTTFNLAHIVSFRYSPKTRELTRMGTGFDEGRRFPTGENESMSTLVLQFLGTESKTLSGIEADTKWKELTELLTIDPTVFSDSPVHQPAPPA